MKLGTREILQKIDKSTMEDYGIPGLVLMENAGRAVSNVIIRDFPEAFDIAIFCGSGNNGGDGFVAARHLMKRGRKVTAYITKNIKDHKGDAGANLNALIKSGGKTVKLNRELSNFAGCDLVVDAIFGTGLDREVKDPYGKIIEFINGIDRPVVSVDMPSGIDANNGKVLGVSVIADTTVTFVMPKIGIAVYPGADYAGRLYIADISTPSLVEKDIKYELVSFSDCRVILKPRQTNSHKGTYGHLLTVAGSTGKSGAAYLCSLGAARAGTGLVTAAIPEAISSAMELKTTEIMTEPVNDRGKGYFCRESIETVLELSRGKSAIATGPGLSTNEETAEFLLKLIQKSEVPVVIDADAINIIAQNQGILRKARQPLILTPHPGEMARLCNTSSSEIQKERIGFSMDFAVKNKVHLVLKGARTVMATPEGKIFINPTGNPGMASGGMGDVLTGMIAGFLSQGYSPEKSCILAVFLHGLAGDIVAEECGEFGYLASEVADALPEAARLVMETDEEPFFEIIH